MRAILAKIGYNLSILLGVVVLIFSLFVFLPDASEVQQGQQSDKKTQENIKKSLGLDKPKYIQLIEYLNDISPLSYHHQTQENTEKYGYFPIISLNGKVICLKKPYLGVSYQKKRAVREILSEALPNTLVLSLVSFLLASIIGIVLGVISALSFNTLLDRVISFISVLGISTPSFFLSILLAWFFGFYLHNYTGLNMYGSLYSYDPYQGRILSLSNLILPAIALGIRPLAVISQLMRSSCLDVLGMDYIRTAKAKGLSHFVILIKHILRNALNPVVSSLGGWLASMLAGSFFIEYIFNWQGIGKVTVDALSNADFPLVLGAVLFMALVFIIINILTDVAYYLIDPRIK